MEQWWRQGDTFGLVWGGRRVGKSWLLGRFAADRLSVTHTGGDRPLPRELELFSSAVERSGHAGRRDLTGRPFTSWDEVLDSLASTAASRRRPVLVVLDEFPDLLRSDASLETVLRAFGERAGQRSGLRIRPSR